MSRTQLVDQYDQLIARFGEDPFRPDALCHRNDAVDNVLNSIGSKDAERHKLIKKLTEKSLTCVELAQKLLDVADKFKHIDTEIAMAQRQHDSDESIVDENVEMTSSEDKETVILLNDLITASGELQNVGRNIAHMGIVTKSFTASKNLLSSISDSLNSSPSKTVDHTFRELYMDQFTSAFGDELDRFRQEDQFESKDVSYLISCIHAEEDIFTPLQKKLFQESVGRL